MNKEKEPVDFLIEILRQVKDLKRGSSKEIVCPKCSGKMYAQRSAYNGHIFAKCESDNCITIMQ